LSSKCLDLCIFNVIIIKLLIFMMIFSKIRIRIRIHNLELGIRIHNTELLIDCLILCRAALGGRVRVLLSGGAPLAPDTHEYLKAVLCIQILQVSCTTRNCAPCKDKQ
jgi:long-subunit acyl-CoA synthetase (AMP-forming)